ncbi:MAG: DUF3429 domain-containing protein [Wenzhouxiangella sp.]|nr:MAG: DUF3429 domain-containing protein [Wenzhouxiangella sp.]
MDNRTVHITRILTWSGVIPFAAIALFAILDAPDWLERLLTAYAALILAFLAGTLWTRHLLGERTRPRLLIASNVLVLAAWPAILLPIAWAALWLAVLFAIHLALDEPWRGYGMPGWYRRLRLAVSLTAIGLLLVGGLVGVGLQ